jgi:hypothetical protein
LWNKAKAEEKKELKKNYVLNSKNKHKVKGTSSK